MILISISRAPLFALVLVLTTVAACSSKDQIVGTWQEVGTGTERDEFLADGTVLLQNGSRSLSGKWSRLDDGRLKVEIQMLGTVQTLVCRTEFKGDSLTLTNSDGQVSTYERLK